MNQYKESLNNGFDIHVFPERYLDDQLFFNAYHAAHFLMVVGADGLNYLAPEVKYQPSHVLSDLNGTMDKGFLWHQDRLKRITSVKSLTYQAIRSRHRGTLYSHTMENLIAGKIASDQEYRTHMGSDFMFPHIL
ncbi:MAG: hypothetical protein KJ630_08180 [Proteobacteria bacterium]|nr:hypothetical protein [Pseudomonadota bacterium]